MNKEIEGIVEIGSKPIVERRATATGVLNLSQASAEAIQNKSVKKGDVLEASTIAAIQAVKDTPRIVPHCHPIPLEGCTVNWSWEKSSLRCTVHVSAHYKTGIEMEAPYRCQCRFIVCSGHGEVDRKRRSRTVSWNFDF